MVENPNIDQFQSFFQAFRDEFVRFAGIGYAARVIVRERDSGGIHFKGAFDDFTGVNACAVDGSVKEFLYVDQAVLVVHEQHTEAFRSLIGKMHNQKVLHFSR